MIAAAAPRSPGTAAEISARLDRLPPSRAIWKLVIMLSLAGGFELYDLLMTGYVAPGLVRSGIFSPGHTGLFGLPDQAAFASVTFAGLWVGTIFFGYVTDKLGRRRIFTWALLWYAAMTVIMACQNSVLWIDIWRFIAGIGIGVELVTIDTYVAELVPKEMRGRAFTVNQAIQFCSVPAVALLSWLLVPIDPFGIAGWRYVAVFPALAAALVFWIIRVVPESPRWLVQHGHLEEADRVTADIEARVAAEVGTLPPPGPAVAEEHGKADFSEIWRPPYRRRAIMFAVFNVFQTIGFYGFGNWVPQLLAAQGASFAHSLQYSFIIALASPTMPMLFLLFADKVERKWQICAAALGTAVFGLLFSQQTSAVLLILFGVLITGTNNLLSYAYHAYQAECFPTRMRARAVGFVYSFSRLSTILSSFFIAFFLQNFGAGGVFAFISAAMLVVIISIGGFGPRTKGLALEEISH
jgi:MFS transporter, putative metabolite:H+ symporter